jgi:hypothetical protein
VPSRRTIRAVERTGRLERGLELLDDALDNRALALLTVVRLQVGKEGRHATLEALADVLPDERLEVVA